MEGPGIFHLTCSVWSTCELRRCQHGARANNFIASRRAPQDGFAERHCRCFRMPRRHALRGQTGGVTGSAICWARAVCVSVCVRLCVFPRAAKCRDHVRRWQHGLQAIPRASLTVLDLWFVARPISAQFFLDIVDTLATSPFPCGRNALKIKLDAHFRECFQQFRSSRAPVWPELDMCSSHVRPMSTQVGRSGPMLAVFGSISVEVWSKAKGCRFRPNLDQIGQDSANIGPTAANSGRHRPCT